MSDRFIPDLRCLISNPQYNKNVVIGTLDGEFEGQVLDQEIELDAETFFFEVKNGVMTLCFDRICYIKVLDIDYRTKRIGFK